MRTKNFFIVGTLFFLFLLIFWATYSLSSQKQKRLNSLATPQTTPHSDVIDIKNSDLEEIDNRPEIVELSPAGKSYADHEILQSEGLITFQTRDIVWLGTLDPKTGLFANGDGKETQVDTGVASLSVSGNGPEFGFDKNGWSLYYNKNYNGTLQAWKAEVLENGQAQPTALTRDASQRKNPLASKNSQADTVYLNYALRSGAEYEQAHIAWLDEENPTEDMLATPIAPGTAGFRWLDGTSFFTTTSGDRRNGFGQILLINAETGDIRQVTNDPGIKFDPYGWIAPEGNGSIYITAELQDSVMAVYADTGKQYFEKIAELTIPEESGNNYVQSAEPFVVNDTSYISLTIKDKPGSVSHDASDAQIWIYGIDDDPTNRFVLRCDDGTPGIIRHEAEVYRGENEVYLYYNTFNKGSSIGISLCRTGISSKTGKLF